MIFWSCNNAFSFFLLFIQCHQTGSGSLLGMEGQDLKIALQSATIGHSFYVTSTSGLVPVSNYSVFQWHVHSRQHVLFPIQTSNPDHASK